MTGIQTMLLSLALVAALLAAGIPASAQMNIPSTSGAAHPSELTRVERPKGLRNESTDDYDHYVFLPLVCVPRRIFLPLVHGPSDYPLDPPQIEPGVGEYFPCASCPDGVSDWFLLDYNLDYWPPLPEGVNPFCPPYCKLEAGDVVIEVSARIRNDSDVDYWAWMGGSSYDAEGNFLTGTIQTFMPHPNTRLVPAHETGDFTFHMESDRAIALIRLGVSSSVIPPP